MPALRLVDVLMNDRASEQLVLDEQPTLTPPPARVDTDGDAPSPPLDAAPESPAIVDVWSRTEPKYRVRAVVLLSINLLLYCGLGAFLHWLHVGRAFDFSLSSYFAPARFWDRSAPNLNDFILDPISVVEVPLHAIVLGMSLAVLAAVPIVVSILYRFAWAVPFLLAVFVFAHMPWMAFTLCCSCILASQKPFRMRFRFGSAVVGLLPVVAYLYLATAGGQDEFSAYASPTERSLLIAPWVVTLVAAAVICGVALLLARLVNYRPGAVAPVVTVMVATPVTLFFQGVGVDELAYRVLERDYGPLSERFEPIQSNAETERQIQNLARTEMIREGVRALWSEDRQQIVRVKQRVRRYFLTNFLEDRARAYEACKHYIARFPQSRYLPNVLFIQATVLDMRLDERRLQQSDARRELYLDFPHAQSAQVWLKLYRQYPESPLAIPAALRLAQLELREGKTQAALDKLEFVPDALDRIERATSATQPATDWLSPGDPMSKLEFQPRTYADDARQLADLVRQNRSDPQYGDAPLVELMKIDRRRGRYGDQLLHLAAKYPDSRLRDNLWVRWADQLPTIEARIEKLSAVVRTLRTGDAIPRAYFRIAALEMQRVATHGEDAQRAARQALRTLIAEFPDSIWAELARERLAILVPREAETAKRP